MKGIHSIRFKGLVACADHEPGALCLASRHRQAILLGSEHPSPLSLDSQQTDHRNARYCSIEECILSPLALVNELLCYSTTPIQILRHVKTMSNYMDCLLYTSPSP